MKVVHEKTKTPINGRIFKTVGDNGFFHWHDKCEVLKIVTKSCDFLIDGKIVKGLPGDIVFMNENVYHQFMHNGENSDMKLLQFTVEMVSGGKGEFTPVKTYIPHKEIAAIPNLEEQIDFLWDIIIDEVKDGIYKEDPFLKSITTALYNLLVRHFPDTQVGVRKDKIKFNEVINYIKDHYTEEITVNEIAAKMYMSRTNLSNLFSKYAGTGMNEYINNLRVRNVNNLLLQGKSITEAAMESGFKSVRTFNHVYKKYTDMTPTEYVHTMVNKL